MASTTADAAAPDALATEASATDDTPVLVVPSRPLVQVKGWEIALVFLLGAAVFLPYLGSYCLWDPWETHYGEVARRILADHDWIHLKWQNESFRSKPSLTFWMMALSMKAFGVGQNGGYSGEFVSSHWVEFSVRLPFALWGIAGLMFSWYAIARLYARRAAWLAILVIATCPYYFMITRQAITDMPSCAMLMGSMALFSLAIWDDEKPLAAITSRFKLLERVNWFHVWIGAFSLIMLPQLINFTIDLEGTRFRTAPGRSLAGQLTMLPFWAGYLGVLAWAWKPTKTLNQVWMYFFYTLVGLGALAKGPLAIGLSGLAILIYLVLTGEWHLLKRVEIPRGIIITLTVALPWHFAMFCKDGMPWFNEYVNQHLLNRAFKGVFGDRGTFDYFFSQLGVGMWPWAGFVPVALGTLAFMGKPKTREEKLRLFIGIWAVSTTFFFCTIQTKFHHYILPAVPALATMVALYFDDMLDGRVKWAGVGIGVALVLLAITSVDLVPNQQKLVHLYIFRYDRPWPKGEPWNIDFTLQLFWFAVAMCVAVAAMLAPQIRRFAIYGSGAVALVFAVWTMQVLMVAASPHWGQKKLHEVYYKERRILGVDLIYEGLRELRADWAGGKDFPVRSVIPDTLQVGAPMHFTVEAAGSHVAFDGNVSKIDKSGDEFWVGVPSDERAKLGDLLARAQNTADPPRHRWMSINADRLVAWQLNWRGENFYSGGEIYQHHFEDARTVFDSTDNTEFLNWLKQPARNGKGRKFFIITEKGRLPGFPNILPTPYGKQTFQVEDNSNNKFGLGSFTIDRGDIEQQLGGGSDNAIGPPPDSLQSGGGGGVQSGGPGK
jgi:4-amino-4-deoxy-L-arabinose transferase-like glycosyltransferase